MTKTEFRAIARNAANEPEPPYYHFGRALTPVEFAAEIQVHDPIAANKVRALDAAAADLKAYFFSKLENR